MNKKTAVIGFSLIITAIILSLYFDNQIIRAVSGIRNIFLDDVFLAVTLASSESVIFIILTFLFLWKGHKRRWIVPLWLTLGISAVVSFALKITIHRLRPFQQGIVSLLPSLQEASHDIWNYSFPSSHAIFAFCAVPILSKQYPKLKNLWIGIAILVALSRVYLGLHFLSDILAGGLIGYIIGMLIVRLEKEKKFGEKISEKFESILRRLKRK